MKVLNDYEGAMEFLQILVEGLKRKVDDDPCYEVDGDMLLEDLLELQQRLSPVEK